MRQYLELVKQVLDEGEERVDRTGVGTLSLFGPQVRYDLREGFPLLTTKRVNFDAVKKELFWFLRGETNTRTLGCGIWSSWADKEGELGPIYGHQWRSWGSETIGRIDQIAVALDTLKNDPTSRRNVVSAWNVADLPAMALPPCHLLFQLYVSNGHLDCKLYQRSADLALGVPFNIASYALLMELFAADCGLVPRYLVHSLGDAHVYLNHVAGLREQLKRPLGWPPSVKVPRHFGVAMEKGPGCVELIDYQPADAIKFEVAV